MKISVNSTFSYIKFNLNYGSALQCYALQRYLKNRGHNVSLVRDYRYNPKNILIRLKNIKHFKLFNKKLYSILNMQKFMKNYIQLSEKKYFTYSKLVKKCPDADCHIVGSDQVWHNDNKSRYLTYVSNDKMKISYAASFGKKNISDEMYANIKPYLNSFKGIAVREKSGVDIIKNMGYNATHVIDPTFLLESEDYPIGNIKKSSSFAFCYFLNLKSTEDVHFDLIKKYCSSKDIKCKITAPVNYYLFKKDNVLFPTVPDWLGLYKNADCIFTNTYHGLLFCIIFKKQFVLFLQKGAQADENERFVSLLSLLNLEERVIYKENLSELSHIMDSKIDYISVFSIIEEQRRITDEYFKKFGI